MEPFLVRAESEVSEEGWGTVCRVDPKLSMPTLGNMRIVIDEDEDPRKYDDIFGRSASPIGHYFYVFLNEGIVVRDVIKQLKILAKETADATPP